LASVASEPFPPTMKIAIVIIHVFFVFFVDVGEAAIQLRHTSDKHKALFSEKPSEVKEVWHSKSPGSKDMDGTYMLNEKSKQLASCEDNDDRCVAWAGNGECEKNPSYMLTNCQRSCKVCFAGDSRRPLTSSQIEGTAEGTKVAVHFKDESWIATWWNAVIIALWSFLPYTIMVFILAFIWMQVGGRVPPVGFRRNNGQDFAFGLCELEYCLHDHMWVCICSFCCSAIRMADNYSKSSQEYSMPRAIIPGFWRALCIILAIQFLITLTGGLGFILFVCIAVFLRQRLRKIYGLPNCTGKILAWDCLFWCCCPWCTIAQECRQVQFVTDPPIKYVPSTPLDMNYKTSAWR